MDILVDLAIKQEGVLGARMTGAGFGGCTVNLLKRDCVDTFKKRIKKEYNREKISRPGILVERRKEKVRGY